MKEFFLDFIQNLWFRYLAKIFNLEIYGQKNIPKNTNFIVAANHDGYFDLDFIMYAFGKKKIRFIYEIPKALKFLLKLWYRADGLGVIVYEKIDNKKEINRKALNNAVRYLMENENVGIMPQGPSGYKYEESKKRKFYPGCAIISCRSGKPVIPVRILNDETFIYDSKVHISPVGVIRRAIQKIKSNVRNGSPVILLIGKLIYPDLEKYVLDERKYVSELTAIIKEKIFELEEKFNKGELYV